MADTLEKILTKLGLHAVFPTFQSEKITPNIVSMLSAHELEYMGVSNRADMMKLRLECSKYGNCSLQRISVDCGAPEFNIPKSILENLIQIGFKISDISKLLSVSERTVYRRMARYGLSKLNFSDVSEDELDMELKMIINDYPLCGENFLRQMLSLRNIHVQRWKLGDSIHRIDPKGVAERTKVRLHRRIYNVPCPNDLWHIDTNHKLVRWRFVIIGGIDGFSRMIMFLKCSDNNTSRTVFNCFMSGVTIYGIPNRVRSDKGLENVEVADYMLSMKGKSGMITGKSTHNQRIERLWRVVFEGVLSYFYNLFYYMEDQGVLDSFNDTHLQALHYIYMEDINKKLDFWANAWASHKMRTVKSSPLALWYSGQLQNPVGIVDGIDLHTYGSEGLADDTDDGRPIFQSPSDLTRQCRQTLEEEIPTPRHNLNHGIVDYRKCVEIIERFIS